MTTPWTLAYMEVLSRTQKFANAYLEFRGNPDLSCAIKYARMKLYVTLAIYHGERRTNYGYNAL